MYERYTDRARRVVVLAQEEARLLRHNYLGTEHLLLGLVREGDGVAANAFKSLGVTLEIVRSQVMEIIGLGGTSPSGHIPFTPLANKILELSLREAMQLGRNYIGTEHLLLVILRFAQAQQKDAVAIQVLERLDIPAGELRQRIIDMLNGSYVSPPAEDIESPHPPPIIMHEVDNAGCMITTIRWGRRINPDELQRLEDWVSFVE